MARVQMTKGKFEGITALADARGVIAAAAMDQRGSLRTIYGGTENIEIVNENIEIVEVIRSRSVSHASR